MREKLNDKLEAGRIRKGYYASETGDMHGGFNITGPKGAALVVMSSGTGEMAESWEHVSVSCTYRTPNWDEMCWIKRAFWRDDETVLQFHPPESEYVSAHPYCLHLWRPLDTTIPLPPSFFVGPKITGSDNDTG